MLMDSEEASRRIRLESLVGRIKKVEYVCNKKRAVLLEVGIKRARAANYYHVAAGVLAIVSGGVVSAAIAKYVSPTLFSIIGAVLAFGSGLVSIITSHFFDEKVTQRIFEGAASYAGLRANAELEALRPNLTEKQAYESVKGLLSKYNDVVRYDHYIPLSLTKNWPSSEESLDLPVPGMGEAYPPEGQILRDPETRPQRGS